MTEPSNEELNRWAAEKVMGWPIVCVPDGQADIDDYVEGHAIGWPCVVDVGGVAGVRLATVWNSPSDFNSRAFHPSTDHNDCAAVVRKAAEMGYEFRVDINSDGACVWCAHVFGDREGKAPGPLTDTCRLTMLALRDAMGRE